MVLRSFSRCEMLFSAFNAMYHLLWNIVHEANLDSGVLSVDLDFAIDPGRPLITPVRERLLPISAITRSITLSQSVNLILFVYRCPTLPYVIVEAVCHL